MAINKDFVVKNGLEVNRLLIRTNTTNNRVGINTDVINSTLDVNGQISAKSLSISGVTTFSTINVSSSLQLNGSSGSNGQYLKSTGTGVTWSNFPSTRTTSTITAVLGQTLFGFNYNIGFLDVFINGTKLSSTDFLAVDGNNIILSTPCFGGETVEFISYSVETIGITTTLIIGIGGITIQEEGSVVGLSSGVSTLNFVGSSVTAIASGIGATIYISPNSSQLVTTAAGIHTLSNVGIGTTNPRFALEVGAVGASGTTLFVNGDARITGILTIGTASITLNGATNIINVGSGITINGSTGTINATSINLGGATLTGAGVTSITAGSGISVSQSTGNVTITATGGGSGIGLSISDTPPANTTTYPLWYSSLLGRSFVYYNDGDTSQWVDFSPSGGSSIGGSSQFVTTAAGIHTLSNVGIGTTNPTSKLTVSGDILVSGIITASSFSGNASSATYATSAGIATFTSEWILGANGSSDYTFTGPGLIGAENDPILYLVRGQQYKFTNTMGAHPFRIQSTVNGSTGTQYNDGITNNDVSNGTLTWNVQFDAPNILYYQCTAHGSMGGKIYIIDAGIGPDISINTTGIISATTFYGNLVGSITDATNLTGGYANASQLNVSGVATISQGRIQADGSSNLRFGNIAAGSGSGRNIAIGDQVLYSLSSGQGRNIGIGELSYYDTTSGQYNIGLGIQAGQKITTGNYNVILGGYDGQTGLDIRTSSNNVVIADGQGNIRQYINSSGNVGIKTTVITEALTVAGIVSATSFYGTLNAGQLTGSLPAINGSALIGVVGSGSGIIIQDDTTPVGTAGTINFGSNINVTFASGIATVSVPSVTYASVAGVATVATNAQGLTGTPSITVTNVTANRFILPDCGNIVDNNNTEKLTFGTTPDFKIYHLNESGIGTQNRIEVKNYPLYIGTIESYMGDVQAVTVHTNLISVIPGTPGTNTSRVVLGFGGTNTTYVLQTTGYGVSITGGINASGIITASSFSGSGSGLTNIPAGQLTGTLPAIDGSALLNVTAAGTGVAIRDDNSNIGSATTVNFGTGLDVTFSSGIATITASGGSLQSRTTVSGVTTSIANLGIGNTNITGFKSYALMKVGLSTTGWLRLYTDSTSRANDASRSVGEDPAPGSGVIAEVVTTGITTTQIISPFVMGGNLDNSPTTTIYAAITNLSGTTQAITANLTILQLEA